MRPTMKPGRWLPAVALGSAAMLAILTAPAAAAVFTVTAQLTGDARPGSPDLLVVDVTIDVDGSTAQWKVDLNSPAHPNMKLDTFVFNMVGGGNDYSFSNISPTGWTVTFPGEPTGGGFGNIVFDYGADNCAGQGCTDVTNTVDLTFTQTKIADDFLLTDFTNAETLTGAAGSGQLGAHLQSLTVNGDTCPLGGCSDSGFALGNYVPDGGGDPTGEVPEPGSIALFGSGLLGLYLARRRRRS